MFKGYEATDSGYNPIYEYEGRRCDRYQYSILLDGEVVDNFAFFLPLSEIKYIYSLNTIT